MTPTQTHKYDGQAGFTLVELAIVMIIIGLLIGGILKGQELIANAALTATVAQVKSLDGATSGFDDKYDALPGDMANANNRLTNCTLAPCNAAGNGDGDLEGNLTVPSTGERRAYFVQLARAGFITGIDGNQDVSQFEVTLPEAEIGGGWQVGTTTGVAGDFSALIPTVPPVPPVGGTYLVHVVNPGVPGDSLTPNQAQRLDTKLDDGNATTGTVVAGAGTIGNCWVAANNEYNEAIPTNSCRMHIRIQN